MFECLKVLKVIYFKYFSKRLTVKTTQAVENGEQSNFQTIKHSNYYYLQTNATGLHWRTIKHSNFQTFKPFSNNQTFKLTNT